MNERIKEFAEQAGIEYSSQWTYWTAYGQDLERFAELVRQDERKVNRELLEALKLAQAIIGHPDDQESKFIAAVIAKAEE